MFNKNQWTSFTGVVTEKSLKALEDVPNIIMLVLECVEDVSLHFQLIETLMMFKDNLWIVSFIFGCDR